VIAGVRRSVWIASAALLASALLLASGLRSVRATRAGEAVATAAIEAVSAAPSVAPTADAAAVAPVVGTASEAPPADSPVAPPSAPEPAEVDAQRARVDSRLDADLRVLEDDAAGLAESRGLVDPALLDAAPRARGPAPNAAREDARRIALADAALVDHFVQDAYQGTEFPIGYPAEERTRAAARSYVRSLTPELRRDLLEIVVATQAGAPEPIGPLFAPPESGLVWEGAIR
jgi:hypothetical protein